MDLTCEQVSMVRQGLERAIRAVKAEIKQVEEYLDKNDAPAVIRESLEGILSFHKQWLRDAIEQYRDLPDSLRPSLDD